MTMDGDREAQFLENMRTAKEDDAISRQAAIDALLEMLNSDYLDGYKYLEKLKQLPSEGGQMADLIERQAAIDAVNNCGICIQKILDVPSVQQERKKGKWIDLGKDRNVRWQCSKCGRRDTHIYNYCPDCGSDNSWRRHER